MRSAMCFAVPSQVGTEILTKEGLQTKCNNISKNDHATEIKSGKSPPDSFSRQEAPRVTVTDDEFPCSDML